MGLLASLYLLSMDVGFLGHLRFWYGHPNIWDHSTNAIWDPNNFQKLPQGPCNLRIVYTTDYHYTSILLIHLARLLYNLDYIVLWGCFMLGTDYQIGP